MAELSKGVLHLSYMFPHDDWEEEQGFFTRLAAKIRGAFKCGEEWDEESKYDPIKKKYVR